VVRHRHPDCLHRSTMTEYFASRPQVQPINLITDEPPGPSTELDIHDRSIYIFPNPPSVRTSDLDILLTPASTNSAFSLLSSPGSEPEATFGVAGFRSDSLRARGESLASSETGVSDIVWDPGWTPRTDSDVDGGVAGQLSPLELELERAIERASSNWHVVHRPLPPAGSSTQPLPALIFRPTVNPRVRQVSHLSDTLPRSFASESTWSSKLVRPYPRIQIPLLSFFASLLSVDDDTVDLITNPSSTHSALFPGPALTEEGEDAENGETYGLSKLLAPDDTRTSLVEGSRVACESPVNPFAVYVGTAGLWNVVTGVLKNGRRVWRAVWVQS
jgi:hypothetical protein